MSEGLIRDHVAAVNSGNIERVMSGFTLDAVWSTGTDTYRGTEEIRALFTGAFDALQPRLAVRRVLASGTVVAAELTETWTGEDGTQRLAAIAGFFSLGGGKILEARIYREGSAEP
ncbi:MAG: nuclear transport factor 2 family protein [Mycobacteriales bacterium]